MTRTVALYVYGASGHGSVVAEAARQSRGFSVEGYLDDDASKWGGSFDDLPVIGGIESAAGLSSNAQIALGVGSNTARKRLAERLVQLDARLATVIHPSAVVSRGVSIGEGSFVGPLVLLHVNSRIGRGCIINSSAVIEHDNIIGDWSHVSPGAALGGAVSVGEGAHVGLGASVIPGLSVGAWSIVGSGAVVVRPVPESVVAVGVPARVLRPVT